MTKSKIQDYDRRVENAVKLLGAIEVNRGD